MRNPNGYGTVAKLSGKRRRPYIVKKVVGWNENGFPVYAIVGYAETREAGNILLANYNHNPWDVDLAKITLQQLFDLWDEKKGPKLGKSNRAALRSAYKHCMDLGDNPYRQIKAYQMQETIDLCGRGPSTQALIKNLWGHLDRFALEMDITGRCYSDLLTSAPVPESSRDRLSDEVIQRLWGHQDEPWVDTILIFIYTGWRITELLTMGKVDVDLNDWTMKGGVKTKAGKNRIVPIHSKIQGLVERRMNEPGEYFIQFNGGPCSPDRYRVFWREIATRLQFVGTPHSCRHTFESLLDSAGGNRKCIDLLMGHVSKDTGNRVYNHKTLNELRATVELIKV